MECTVTLTFTTNALDGLPEAVEHPAGFVLDLIRQGLLDLASQEITGVVVTPLAANDM